MHKLLFLIFISLLPYAGFAQNQPTEVVIIGTVTNQDNKPLPFATVSCDGLGEGTVSDSMGRYRLHIPFHYKIVRNQALAAQYLHRNKAISLYDVQPEENMRDIELDMGFYSGFELVIVENPLEKIQRVFSDPIRDYRKNRIRAIDYCGCQQEISGNKNLRTKIKRKESDMLNQLERVPKNKWLDLDSLAFSYIKPTFSQKGKSEIWKVYHHPNNLFIEINGLMYKADASQSQILKKIFPESALATLLDRMPCPSNQEELAVIKSLRYLQVPLNQASKDSLLLAAGKSISQHVEAMNKYHQYPLTSQFIVQSLASISDKLHERGFNVNLRTGNEIYEELFVIKGSSRGWYCVVTTDVVPVWYARFEKAFK
ncbi:MAG: hypothetical protein AB8F95_12880 [Bacteroidia bacterium]